LQKVGIKTPILKEIENRTLNTEMMMKPLELETQSTIERL
jgi:hypothetical protein